VPLHVTTRLCDGLPSLRDARTHSLLIATLKAGCERFGFRLVEYSVQRDHFHWLVEVDGRVALMRGAKGLLVRVAKALNKCWGRKGQVIEERYHARALESPREVRNGLVYVLHNARKHGQWGRGVDPFSSGPWFDGFSRPIDPRSGARGGPQSAHTRAVPAHAAAHAAAAGLRGPGDRGGANGRARGGSWVAAGCLAQRPRPVCRARTWLLAIGWRRHGAIDPDASPAPARRFTD
jgi:REP element-mobilizing transposase RayT